MRLLNVPAITDVDKLVSFFSEQGSKITWDKATGTVLATVSGTDSTYASGEIGFGVAAQSFASGASAQAVFGNLSVASVPEPSTWALAVTGLVGLGWTLRRRSE